MPPTYPGRPMLEHVEDLRGYFKELEADIALERWQVMVDNDPYDDYEED